MKHPRLIHPIRVRRLAPALALVTALGMLGACGTDDDASADGLTQISVGNFPNTLLTVPLGVAEGEGFFADEGLSVKIIPASGGPQLVAAMLGGSTQFTPVPSSVAIAAMVEGQELQVLPPFEQENLVFAVPVESDASELDDLVGERIGVAVRGGAAEIFATDVLREKGIDPGDVTFVAAGTAATMQASLDNDQVDAIVSSNSSVVAINQESPMTVLASALDGTAGERGSAGLASFYVTTPEYKTENEETVTGFCRALTAAAEWIADESNRDETIGYISSWTGVTDEDSLETLYETSHQAWQEELDEERWEANVAFASDGDISYDQVNATCG